MLDIDQYQAQQIIKNFQIPPKPQILIEIQEVQAQSNPSAKAFADVISKDVALSAAVLKMINSPVFGLRHTISNIRQSVVLLGNNNIVNLVSFFQLRKALNKKSSISHEKYWDTAMETANMMTVLIEHMLLQEQCSVEDAYSFGLFRDCGIPLMAMKFNNYKQVLIEANSTSEQIFTDIEDSYYQTNHATIGYFIASSWNFPKDLCQLISRHHETDFLYANDTTRLNKYLYALAKLASNILSQHHYIKNDSEWLLSKDAVLGFFELSDLDYLYLEEDVKEIFKIKFAFTS